jgi:acetyltransferase-like isoleucine patch superfamily enzyme
MARGRNVFKKFKGVFNILTKFFKLFPMKLRKKLFEHYRNKKGKLGLALRYILLKSIAKKCGDNVSIHPDCYIFAADNLEIGDNVSIHPMCYIDATGGIEIGDDVSIAHAVSILSTSHNYLDHNVPIKDQGCDYKKTVIGNNVWLGAKATIMYGKHIGDGVIIGANSVVTRDVENNMIAAGSPAKVIKER